MKNILVGLFICAVGQLSAALFEVHGTYQGDNLIIQNAFNEDTKSFCISSVYLNGQDMKVDVKHLTIELHFEKSLTVGDPINLRVYHKAGCKPTLVNERAIKRASLFSFVSFKVNAKQFNWSTRGEQKDAKLSIQRYQYGEWVDVASVVSKGGMSGNNYVLPTAHYSGINRYRIVYIQQDGVIEYGESIDFKSNQQPINFFPTKVKGKITFANNNHLPVKYFIYDIEGHKIMEGEGLEIDCIGLEPKEVYTLVFDNQHKKFQKMKSDK
jgi:hypothetical protein